MTLLLWCAACSDDPNPVDEGVDPDPTAVLRIEILPADVVLSPNESRKLNATVYGGNNQALSNMSVTWSSADRAVATVDAAGNVAALSAGATVITASSGGKTATANVVVIQPPTGAVIDVVPASTHQTMTGWEGTTQIGQISCPSLNLYRGELINRLVNELGINRVRMELKSGAENPTDYYGRYASGQVPSFQNAYEIINDNSDPNVMNASGFHFSQLDHVIDLIIQPMRDALAARGERLYVNLNYVDFGVSTFEHAASPPDYGELLVAAFQHIRSKYGWVPDAVEAILEPDNTTNWRAREIGTAIVAAGDRLAAAGFRPAFIAPSNRSMTVALQFFDSMMAMPRVREYLTDLAYHRYVGVGTNILTSIGARTQQYGVRTSMLEHITADYDELHADLITGRVSAWQRYTLAFCTPTASGGSYYWIDQTNPAAPRVVLKSESAFLRQYFLFVRLGAVRIGALSGDTRFSPVAFRNTNGKHVVVVKATASGNFSVRMLPAGTYGIMYTTSSAAGVERPDQVIASGQTLSTSIPGAGVLTIYQR